MITSQQRSNRKFIIVNIFKVQWIESNLSSGQDVFMEIYRKFISEIISSHVIIVWSPDTKEGIGTFLSARGNCFWNLCIDTQLSSRNETHFVITWDVIAKETIRCQGLKILGTCHNIDKKWHRHNRESLFIILQLTGLKLGPAKEYIDTKEQSAQPGERNLDQVIFWKTRTTKFLWAAQT